MIITVIERKSQRTLINIMIALNVREKEEGSMPHGVIPARWIRRVESGMEEPSITIAICLRKTGSVPGSILKRRIRPRMVQRMVYEKCTQYHIPGS